jgi:molybdopterin-guanine dinucleotide biosynthesis protein B
LQTPIVAVVGGKSSGKTTTIEILTGELIKRGYKVAAIKHVPEPNFTIDTEGKDTWRFAKSGAKTIISIASNEIATIEKASQENISLSEILRKCKGNDIVFIEGLKKLVAKRNDVQKIVIVNSEKQALEALKNFKPILAFAGAYSTANLNLGIPYFDVLKEPKKIADLVENVIKKGFR